MNLKNRKMILSMCMGLGLAAGGCGAASESAEREAVASQSRADGKSAAASLTTRGKPLAPVMLPPRAIDPEDGGGGGGGGGGGTPAPAACDSPGGGMSLGTFQALAGTNTSCCVSAITEAECKVELDYALSHNLITCDAYRWGRSNGYYPEINRYLVIGAVCKCGCFEAKTLLMTSGAGDSDSAAWTPADQIKPETQLAALDESSTLSRPSLVTKPIKALTSGPEKPQLYVFGLDNGRKLKVTQHHGMVLSDGRVVPAKSLAVGSKFVGLAGESVRVNSLTFETPRDDVHNFEVVTETKAGHILAAEGVLVGDLAWQNQLASELGSIALRR